MYRKIYFIIVTLGILIFIIYSSLYIMYDVEFNLFRYFIFSFFGLIIIILSFLAYVLIQRNVVNKYSIAVVGFPQSGKTTLITGLFDEMFNMKSLKNKITPRGSTIDKISEDISRLEVRKKISPTTDQDLFAYRIDFNVFDFPFFNKFKIEIGDCPGEDSRKFTEEYGEWFHKTPFFNWVIEADVFIFIIDLAMEYSSDEYHASIVKAIRAAWLHILEYHIEGKKNTKDKSVLLIFSKGDLLLYNKKDYSDYSLKEIDEINNIGFGETYPYKIDYLNEDIKNKKIVLCEKYNDIISYLKSQSRYFSLHFASYFAYEKENMEKMGINEIIEKMLPR